MAERENWRDIEGNPYVVKNPVTGEQYFYGGCYAYVPFKTNGLVVNGTDEWYDTTNFKTSLREAVSEAQSYVEGLDVASYTNELVITFDKSLFGEEADPRGIKANILFNESQIDVDGFTNVTLVLRGPSNNTICLDGQNEYRAFRIRPGNRVRFENLEFKNCYGSTFGTPQATADGGAVQNGGILSVSNCVFLANSAGGQTYDPNKVPVGFGGALATLAGATTTVYAASFVQNQAVRGGAIYTYDGGATKVFHSTFNENRSVGTSSSSKLGSAVASDPAKTNSCLWLVNCTIAGNRVPESRTKAGAVCAKAGLVLLDSIVVGNTTGEEADDIYVANGGSASFAYTVFGTRSQTNNSYKVAWDDVQAYSGCTIDQVLAVTNVVEANTVPSQWTMPIDSSSEVVSQFQPAAVWLSKDWLSLGYSESFDTKCERALVGSKGSLVLRGVNLTIDQVGRTYDNTVIGSVADMMSKKDEQTDPGTDPDDPGDGDEEAVTLEEAVAWRVTSDGKTVYYRTVEELVAAMLPSDQVVLKDSTDEDAMFALYDALEAQANAAGWYTMETEDGINYTFKLKEDAVRPTIQDGDFDVSDQDVVRLMPTNIKPGLWYALAHSDSVEGPYEADEWVQADADGKLAAPLEAPRTGASGYYRVVVTQAPPKE